MYRGRYKGLYFFSPRFCQLKLAMFEMVFLLVFLVGVISCKESISTSIPISVKRTDRGKVSDALHINYISTRGGGGGGECKNLNEADFIHRKTSHRAIHYSIFPSTLSGSTFIVPSNMWSLWKKRNGAHQKYMDAIMKELSLKREQKEFKRQRKSTQIFVNHCGLLRFKGGHYSHSDDEENDFIPVENSNSSEQKVIRTDNNSNFSCSKSFIVKDYNNYINGDPSRQYSSAYKITEATQINLLGYGNQLDKNNKDLKTRTWFQRSLWTKLYRDITSIEMSHLKDSIMMKKTNAWEDKTMGSKNSFSLFSLYLNPFYKYLKNTSIYISQLFASTFLVPFIAICKQTFLPVGYPRSVPSDYLPYQGWNILQDVSTYLRGILATKAILEGVGVGREGATALAATLQWVARDGASMLGGLLFTSFFSSDLAANIKKWRLVADISVDIGITLEMIAPLYQPLFLYLICLASISKAICGIAAGATGAQINQHWSLTGNLADISAKSSAQHTAVSFLSLGLGVLFAKISAENVIVLWSSYIGLTFLHLLANYKAMRILAFTSLNRERLDVLFTEFLQRVLGVKGAVDLLPGEKSLLNITKEDYSFFSPKYVAKKETIFFDNKNIFNVKRKHMIRVGVSLKDLVGDGKKRAEKKRNIDAVSYRQRKEGQSASLEEVKEGEEEDLRLYDLVKVQEKIKLMPSVKENVNIENQSTSGNINELQQPRSLPFLLTFDEQNIKVSFNVSITKTEKISALLAATFLQNLLLHENYHQGNIEGVCNFQKLHLIEKALLLTEKNQDLFISILKKCNWEVNNEKDLILGNDEKYRIEIESY